MRKRKLVAMVLLVIFILTAVVGGSKFRQPGSPSGDGGIPIGGSGWLIISRMNEAEECEE